MGEEEGFFYAVDVHPLAIERVKEKIEIRLKDDLGELYEFMDEDEILRGLSSELYGLRPPGIGASVFEGAIRVIIQQQISLQVAYVMTGAVVRRFGEKVEINGESYYDFPLPRVLANARETELILITTLRRMNHGVPDDLGARKAVSHFYYDGKLQPGDVVRESSKRWGEFKGWVIYYLI